MKKLEMTTQSITFEEGCNKYLENCRQRNLSREIIFLFVFVNVNVLSARNLFICSKSLFFLFFFINCIYWIYSINIKVFRILFTK